MNDFPSTPERAPATSAELAQKAKDIEFSQITGSEVLPVAELPIFIRLGRTAVFAIIDPAQDLTPEARGFTPGSDRAINRNIDTLLVEPSRFSVADGQGYQAVREAETVILGRAHEHEHPRFGRLADGVSRNHSSITKTSDGLSFVIHDLNSLNGTYIGRPKATAPNITNESYVHEDDTLSGDTLEIELEAQPAPKAIGTSYPAESRAAAQDRGEADPNQDAYMIDTENQVYGVFDGVGGEKNGALASFKAKRLYL